MGVLATNRLKSHLHFDMLASMASVPLLEQSRKIDPYLTDWKSHWTTSSYTYVRLRAGTVPKRLRKPWPHWQKQVLRRWDPSGADLHPAYATPDPHFTRP